MSAGLADRVLIAGPASSEAGPPSAELRPGVEVARWRLRTGALPRNLVAQVLKGIEFRRRALAFAASVDPVLVQAHGIYMLGTAVAIGRARGIPVIYDPHELETERNGLRGARQQFDRWLESRSIRRVGATLAVCDSIADWYEARYGIPRPTVVRNIPDVRWQGPRPTTNRLREHLGIGPEPMLFLYQGAFSTGRRIEQLIRVFAGLGPDRRLVLMGYGYLEGLVRDAASRHPNIHFVPAVPPTQVLSYTSGADVGICGGENVCLSYYYSLPNKLFEYLLSGLPLLVPDWPEMRRIVDGHRCGWVVDESDDAWRTRVAQLTREQVRTAAAAAVAAGPAYSWTNEEQRLVAVYRRLLGAPTP